ncbi:hypothetical protein Z517_05671 [Fonsecaea pedrosoi CBS 271.37]|uniref:Unplaced genomic scaffold supercont1.3, whole genome shotgun sequence n=1 Tax=Fonsecaea pedrosoi CBS 271.37 TaxID=1442368 RepID=A0A0D2HDU0_9EURO|nr:uncharacterized protein Z517_05671 [Fonsecaea pedrosoi CBS 271.37]KIW82644.1 hypothetical protein Z517_05671 [Fonsecaea pedrosoi CBS 271.37]
MESITGLNSLFYKRIQPMYSGSHLKDGQLYLVTHWYWSQKVGEFIDERVEAKKKYDQDLENAFRAH